MVTVLCVWIMALAVLVEPVVQMNSSILSLSTPKRVFLEVEAHFTQSFLSPLDLQERRISVQRIKRGGKV